MKKYILKYCQSQLNLKNTLLNGQCFNWQQSPCNTFSGVLFNHYFELKRIDPALLEVQVYPDLENLEQKLDHYFYKTISLKDMYKNWVTKQQKFRELSKKLPGTRIVKQDPWECTISFICSSNNNISRISSLLRALKTRFGKKIIEREVEGKVVAYHEFPSLEELLRATEDDLREMGFGYRAEFIIDSVKAINANGGYKWVNSLEGEQYEGAKEKLMTLKGIGRKVADCICLFSLGYHGSVPIDTHMFQIAKKLGYVKQNQVKKSMSQTLYRKIAQSYRDVYGDYAGWAQQIIFTGDLASFQSTISPKHPSQSTTTSSKTLPQTPVKLKLSK